jgi:hypothetical protein
MIRPKWRPFLPAGRLVAREAVAVEAVAVLLGEEDLSMAVSSLPASLHLRPRFSPERWRGSRAASASTTSIMVTRLAPAPLRACGEIRGPGAS